MYAKYTRRAGTSIPGPAYDAQQKSRRRTAALSFAKETAAALISAAGLMFFCLCAVLCITISA